MRRRQSVTWVLLLSILIALAPTGAAWAAPAAAPLGQGGEPAFKLDLPRIVVTVDKDGYPSIFGLSVQDIQRMTGMDMSMARLPADLLQMMTDAGVQNFEVTINGQGVFLYANGKPLPYLVWSQESLANLASVLAAFQVPQAALVGEVAPFLQYISISLAVQFAVPEGVTAASLRNPKDLMLVDAAAAASEVAEKQFIVLHALVDVDAEGVPSIMGVSTRRLQELTGMDMSTAVVPANLMAQLSAGGVQHVQVQTLPSGLFLYLNGKPLPNLAWDAAHLATLAELLPKLMAAQPWAPLAGQAVPTLQATDVQLTVRFPLPAGAQEQPLHEFAAP